MYRMTTEGIRTGLPGTNVRGIRRTTIIQEILSTLQDCHADKMTKTFLQTSEMGHTHVKPVMTQFSFFKSTKCLLISRASTVTIDTRQANAALYSNNCQSDISAYIITSAAKWCLVSSQYIWTYKTSSPSHPSWKRHCNESKYYLQIPPKERNNCFPLLPSPPPFLSRKFFAASL